MFMDEHGIFLWVGMCAAILRDMVRHGKGPRRGIGDRSGQGFDQCLHAKMHVKPHMDGWMQMGKTILGTLCGGLSGTKKTIHKYSQEVKQKKHSDGQRENR